MKLVSKFLLLFLKKFKDLNGDLLNFSASDLPAGLSLSADGYLTGSTEVVRNNNISITASDSQLSTTAQLSLTITGASSSSSGGSSLLYLLVYVFNLLVLRRQNAAKVISK
jgi:hypothetical protein